MAVMSPLGEPSGQTDDEPEAILKVAHLRLTHDPGPVERPTSWAWARATAVAPGRSEMRAGRDRDGETDGGSVLDVSTRDA